MSLKLAGKYSGMLVIAFYFIMTGSVCPVHASDNNFLNDIEILYFYESEGQIDWPLLYHLGAEEDCRVNMVQVLPGPEFAMTVSSAPRYNLYSYRITLPKLSWAFIDSVGAALDRWRLPDIVILAGDYKSGEALAFERYLLSTPYDETKIFNIEKFYRRDYSGEKGTVHINRSYCINGFQEQLIQAAGFLTGRPPALYADKAYSTYLLEKTHLPGTSGQVSIISGVEKDRFSRLLEKYVDDPLMAAGVESQMQEYRAQVKKALEGYGVEKIEAMMTARDALSTARRLLETRESDTAGNGVAPYITEKLASVTESIFSLTGIFYHYEPVIKNSPRGPKLKLLVEVVNNGPLYVRTGRLSVNSDYFENSIIVDTRETEILPYNTLAREYTVDLPGDMLESFKPESLLIAGEIKYNERTFDYKYHAVSRAATPVTVSFIPDFLPVRPFPEIEIDRIVSPLELKGMITKPASEELRVRVDISTPPGLMVGAYEKNVVVPVGLRSCEFKIPLVATRALTRSKSPLVISISDGGSILAADTAFAGIVDYRLDPKVRIALLSGDDGRLEDIFRMTGANFSTISDRYLETGNIHFYDVIAIAGGAQENYASLPEIDGRLRQFMEYGGTVLVFGQDRDWSDDILPASIVAAKKAVHPDEVIISQKKHRIFDFTFSVSLPSLLGKLNEFESYPAAVFPSDRILGDSGGNVMLSESRFGKGRLIYCGLPVVEMVCGLDDEGARLFSNLINYSGQ